VLVAGIFARRAVSAPKVEGEKIVAFKYLGSVVVPSLKDDINVANRSSRAPIFLRAPQYGRHLQRAFTPSRDKKAL
jgi:hypothetical protein